ncbi:hypothetical protein FRC10_003175 [Ceratobasidium sp. 414]|nr:hypothetical protein FRC10_003175 [Ceratobasidium sp. 414]
MMLTMTTAPATVSPSRSRPRRPPSSVTTAAALARLGLPLGFPLPPLTVPRPPMSPPMSPVQTKEVEYYRAAPSAPGSHSIDLERVHPVVRPTRSPSDPHSVAPLAIHKRVRVPAAIVVPDNAARPELRLPPSPAAHLDDAKAKAQPRRGPAPGPPPQGPLPPLPDQQAPFTAVDPLVLRAVAARERREPRRQSKTPDDMAALERSMRRLSRISLATSATSPGGDTGRTSGPTSPTVPVAGRESPFAQVGRAERAEKLLRRISRQSDGIRLPSDYGRVGISGYSVPSSAPVSPALRGVPPLLRHNSETETSELAYLAERPGLSVPMRRNVQQAHSAPGAYTPSVPEPNNGLGLTLVSSDSVSSTLASTSMDTLPSITSMSTLSSDGTLATLSSESTIRPSVETRSSRLGSLSSASSAGTSVRSSQTFETASSSSLLTPISPPTMTAQLPKPPRSPMSPPRPLKMKATLRLSSPRVSAVPSRTSSPDIPSILAQFREAQSLPVPVHEIQPVPATRTRPGARPRLHSDLAPLDVPPPVPAKDVPVGPKGERAESTRSSTESRVAIEDSRLAGHRAGEDGNVLDVPPTRPSLDSQATPRVARSAAPTPTPKTATLSRPVSPDISYILSTTPRPTRRPSVQSLASSAATSRRPSGMGSAPPSSFKAVPGLAGPSRRGSEMSITSSRRSSSSVTASSQGLDIEGAGPELFFGEQYDSEDSDSDLDLSTPLPHMMLRAGLLSPRSTIITELVEMPLPASQSNLSARGEALRLKGEKVWKAESKRKVRHRDGRNLRDGVGLTTGLGWSDSEDEDAPSPLRRRLSSVLLAKAQSRPASRLSRQSALTLSRCSMSSNIDSTSVSSQSLPRTPSTHPLSLPLTPSSLPGAAPGADEFGKLDFPLPPTATSWRGQPSPALRRFPSNTMLRSATATPAVPPTPSALRTRTPSSTSSAASNVSARTPARSKMPTPTPRPSRINIRAPATTRLSAPEPLREAESLVSSGSRRLSGA